MTMLGRCCLCEPPIPYVGYIRRYMHATAIADYNSLSDANYTSKQLYGSVARNFPTSTSYYGGHLLNCLTHTLEIPATATGEQSVIMQPIRFTIDETNSNGGTFDYWRSPTGLDTYRAHESQLQLFSSDTLLPSSGNSHVDNTNPSNFTYYIGVHNGFYHMWQQAAGYEWTGFSYRPPLPRNYGIRPRYIQMRKNGTAYGSLIDLQTFNDDYKTQTGFFYGRYMWPSTSSMSKYYLSAAVSPGWSFVWSDGDTLDLDIWMELVADPDIGQTVTKYVPISLAIDEDASGSHQTSDYSSTWIPSGAALQANTPISTGRLQLSGLDVAVGYTPSTDTYTYTPDDGTAVMGKAVSTDGTFSTDSGSLTWEFTRTITGSAEPGVGTSEWVSINGQPWQLEVDNCTIGEPTEPTASPPAPTTPPTNTTDYGGCEVPAEDRTLTVNLYHIWRDEMCYIGISWKLSATYYLPQVNGGSVYRPKNATPTPDYATTVYSRRDGGSLTIGPAGCFDHLGTTVFELVTTADDVQDGTTYDNKHSDLPTELQDIVPTSITVTHSTQ